VVIKDFHALFEMFFDQTSNDLSDIKSGNLLSIIMYIVIISKHIDLAYMTIKSTNTSSSLQANNYSRRQLNRESSTIYRFARY